MNNLLLEYGGFGSLDNELEIKKDEVDFIDLIKIIKINDYENNVYLKITQTECAICLENFILSKSNEQDILTLLNEYSIYNCASYYNLIKREQYKIMSNNDNCIISCYHVFHKKCLFEWYQKDKTCPLCRNRFKNIK